jgi:hypothetical protein
MTTLMREDPQTSADKARCESVDRPCCKASRGVHPRAGECDVLGAEHSIAIFDGLVEAGEHEEIRGTVRYIL